LGAGAGGGVWAQLARNAIARTEAKRFMTISWWW
jgi:hypothetical protein